MGKSSIEWVAGKDGKPGKTWNMIRARRKDTGKVGTHCEKPSAECKFCYAETHNKRNLPAGGTALAYTVGNRDLVDIFVDEKALTAPLRWRKPCNVFPCSLTDLFGEFVPFEMIDRVFAVMALTPHITYMVLTKRAARMREYMTRAGGVAEIGDRAKELFATHRGIPESVKASFKIYPIGPIMQNGEPEFGWRWFLPWPLPNVILGVSVGDQETANLRIPDLLATPSVACNVSYEPAIGPVNFRRIVIEPPGSGGTIYLDALKGEGCSVGGVWPYRALDQVIIGGESGAKARPFDVQWARDLIAQCRATGRKCFVKQMGAKPMYRPHGDDDPKHLFNGMRLLKSNGNPLTGKGENISEWPIDLRVRQVING